MIRRHLSDHLFWYMFGPIYPLMAISSLKKLKWTIWGMNTSVKMATVASIFFLVSVCSTTALRELTDEDSEVVGLSIGQPVNSLSTRCFWALSLQDNHDDYWALINPLPPKTRFFSPVSSNQWVGTFMFSDKSRKKCPLMKMCLLGLPACASN